MTETNLRVLLKSRPKGAPTAADFAFDEAPAEAPAKGEVLVRHRFLSLDPYQRGRMNDSASYAKPVGLGEVMEGECVGEVVESRHPGFQAGDWVGSARGWQRLSTVHGSTLVKLPELAGLPPSAFLGVLGMPGTTAWVGVTEMAPPRPGDVFVVAAASGAVGGVAGQLAKRMGARVVGIAGGADKCRYVTEELGFDACLDHRGPDLGAALDAACPEGIDVYFENVGGAVQEAVLPRMRDFGRVAFCGTVATYNAASPPAGPNLGIVNRKRLRLQGFIVSDSPRAFPLWRERGAAWIRDGSLRWKEDVVQGLRQAPEAFIGLLAGKNFGKLVIAID